MKRPRVLVFASGTKDGGGSGFENLVLSSELDADIVGVVSNHEAGGVRMRAERLGVPFIHFSGPYDASHYFELFLETGAQWSALSGWLKRVEGLDPRSTFNIHPALLSSQKGRFGGSGMYGSHVLDAVYDSLVQKEERDFGVSMHFVTEEYDRGPIFFEYRIPWQKSMSKAMVGQAVHSCEHEWQPKVTNMVVHGEISWDGKSTASLKVPASYAHLPRRDY